MGLRKAFLRDSMSISEDFCDIITVKVETTFDESLLSS